MNDVAWYWQIMIWVLVGTIIAAAIIQMKFGGVINFVRKLRGLPPKVDAPATVSSKTGGASKTKK
jgi:hypothetical protein